MFKKLRERCKNKKGFTMVELIVVIVIILVLAGALVPSLMKYVNSAKKANCKADAATVFAQLQADYVSAQTEATAEKPVPNEFTISGVKATKQENKDTVPTVAKTANFYVENETISQFIYYDGTYTATWNLSNGKWEMGPEESSEE